MKKTLTIGIAAYNEERNILNIINDIFAQDNTTFTLKKVIVLSDGSADNTIHKAKSVKNSKLLLIDSKDRLGKPARINQIFKLCHTDMVIIFDADIRLETRNIINELIKPLIEDSSIQLSSGIVSPKKPTNLIQKVAKIGVDIWYDCRIINNSTGLYWCDGSLRAFGKELYKNILFPNASADEAFSYLYCIGKGYNFASVKSAVGINVLPSTFSDYLRQIKRYLLSESIQKNNFEDNFVTKNYNIGLKLKNYILLKYLIRKPYLTILYLVITFLARLLYIIDPNDEVKWKILTSTKQS